MEEEEDEDDEEVEEVARECCDPLLQNRFTAGSMPAYISAKIFSECFFAKKCYNRRRERGKSVRDVEELIMQTP